MNFISPVRLYDLYEGNTTMMDYDRVQDFLEAHDMEPERVDPKREAALMLEDMRRGLAGEKSDMPMIPTYLSNDAQLPLGRSVAVIDAGGTNFRSALVCFEEDGCRVSELNNRISLGIIVMSVLLATFLGALGILGGMHSAYVLLYQIICVLPAVITSKLMLN